MNEGRRERAAGNGGSSKLRWQRAARQEKSTRREISTFWERVEKFQQQNIEAARIILRNVDRYGGEGAGLVRWARLTLARAERQAA
jgi:hypothetical protein